MLPKHIRGEKKTLEITVLTYMRIQLTSTQRYTCTKKSYWHNG